MRSRAGGRSLGSTRRSAGTRRPSRALRGERPLHVRLAAFVVVVILAFGAVIVAPRPAAAAPAEPFTELYCSGDADDEGNSYVSCSEYRGLVKLNETPSGNAQYHYVLKECTEFRINGEVVSEGCYTNRGLLHQQDGRTQVSQLYLGTVKTDYRFEYRGTSYKCTFRSTFTYANGEVRHSDRRAECNPPHTF